ncbi:hypothetical protein T11_10493 [Trichinella zimbabwensis]|uniref:Uncharacterized protein n=1 Tax=Trichinella zimbabwensis TaxID=268475 RepID=A0A0V1I8C5_9BILA|nr:hypothetical protein T11_10493 [Trichinella zimbabwensis]
MDIIRFSVLYRHGCFSLRKEVNPLIYTAGQFVLTQFYINKIDSSFPTISSFPLDRKKIVIVLNEYFIG